MSISSILNIAKNSLIASQTSLQVTAHNISNLTTEGYSKQVPLYEAQPAVKLGQAILGNGVFIKGILRQTDRCLERQLAEKKSELEEKRINQAYISRIEMIINDDASGLSKAITDFFNSWQELSLNPLSVTQREGVRISGKNLCGVIRGIYTGLIKLQHELNEKLMVEISEVNRITSEIADLNRRIFEGASGNTGFSDLMDKRQNLIRELSGKLKITYFEDDFGMITVLTKGGSLLVDGGRPYRLSGSETGDQGFFHVFWMGQEGDLVDITSSLSGGILEAIIYLRDSLLESIKDDVDELAKTIMSEVNTLHSSGYSLNGTTGIPFFKALERNFAQELDLASPIAEDLKNIAAFGLSQSGEQTNLPAVIASLVNKKILDGGRTNFLEYVASLNGKVGQLAKNARELFEFSESTYSIVEKQRESVSGVSLDEEIANLIRFQYAYQAAARLFSVADELFKSLIEAVR